ncbi:DUF2889 domain-containing protein [Ramlibacter sp.]|uniref:DUF2889 domain-containing protein n=1 Tax=Ramlibacter sp. TaxID=1917967 RepID=UPI003D130AC9
MPLPPTVEREEIHARQISMKAWRRVDGLFDVESHLVDTKAFAFQRVMPPEPVPAGQPLHDLWVRLVVDADYTIHDVVAVSDTTPFAVCKEATDTLKVLIGEKVGRGWTKLVRDRLGGRASCTHLAEMLGPLATTTIQAVRGVLPAEVRFSPEQKQRQVDTCYAYDAGGEVVRTWWPQFARTDRT